MRVIVELVDEVHCVLGTCHEDVSLLLLLQGPLKLLLPVGVRIEQQGVDVASSQTSSNRSLYRLHCASRLSLGPNKRIALLLERLRGL